MLRAIIVLALSLFAFGGTQNAARAAGPFQNLAGQWSGNGTIELTKGQREPIRCRANYDVLSEQRSLQLNIRCASASYNFDLLGSANYAAGAVNGTWSESTRNAAGTLAGEARGERIQVQAKGVSFSASLTLLTHGDRQSVIIKSQQPDASVMGATINLRRR
ncbi:MAG TPA: hypothetical protein VHD14_02760 [Pseudolabrys sp.]|jgi:hypothetical protein|nr:hypothetical protein [Pseudolabrys sp.]